MGPHIPNTGKIKAFASVKTSSTNWLGQVNNDPLQRVYGIAFPDKAMLKQWQEFQEQAKLRDHRNLGTKQELFFFHQVNILPSLFIIIHIIILFIIYYQ